MGRVTMRMRLNFLEVNSQQDDEGKPVPEVIAGMEPKPNSDFCGFSLKAWYWFCLVVDFVMFGVTVGIYAYRSQNPTVWSSSRMATPLTRTVGLWVSQAAAKNHTFDDLNFGSGVGVSSSCEVFKNTTQTFSTMYVRPVTIAIKTLNLDSGLFITLYFGISGFCYFYMLFDKAYYYKNLNEGRYSVGSYVEQALTIPFMFVVVAAQLGITDISVVLGMVSCSYSSVLFRWIAEELQFTDSMLIYWKRAEFYFYEIAHFTGLMSLAFALVPLFVSLNTLGVCFQPTDVFSTVTETVVLGVAFFLTVIHAIQWYSIEFGYRLETERDKRVEWCYRMEYINTLVCLFLKVFIACMIYPINFTSA